MSSALISGFILSDPIASFRKAQIEPSNIGVESIDDSLFDSFNYVILALMLI